jgi:poly(3-hydroxyalkanoate) depolymerase
VWGAEQVVVVDGRPLRVVRHGDGPPLLLLNGIGAPAEMWAPLVRLLDGRELIALDLPGTGSSPPPRWPMRIRGLAHLVANALDALAVGEADVLGYSFGGMVAQELARRVPSAVRRLVLCATAPGLGSLPPRPLPALLMLTPARYYSGAAARFIVPIIAGGRTRRDPRVLRSHLTERLANPPSGRGYLHQLYAVTGWTSMPWLCRLHQPTLILHGDEDPLAPLHNARHMAKLIPGATLHVVPGGGHLFLLDEPESVRAELARFLK